MKQRKMKKKSWQSFTLIELLMVVAIIAILASVLLPALRKTRDTAKKIQCVGNLKQVSSCWYSYVDDYQGVLPPALWGTYWYVKLYNQLGYDSTPVVQYPGACKKTIFLCPSNNAYTAGSSTQWSYSVNYGMNVACGIKWTSGTGTYSQKIENIANPSRAYILMDGAPIADNGSGAKSARVYIEYSDVEKSGFIHGAPQPAGLTNIMYGDGHVNSEKKSNINTADYTVYRNTIGF